MHNVCHVALSVFTRESTIVSMGYMRRNHKMKSIEHIDQRSTILSTKVFLPNALLLRVETHFHGIKNLLLDRTLNVDARTKRKWIFRKWASLPQEIQQAKP